MPAALSRSPSGAGTFAVEILGKRLLSCPTAFAESWRRCKEGLAEECAAEEPDVDAARRNVERETGDDREAQAREATAAGVVDAWLKNVATDLELEIAAIDAALVGLRVEVSRGDLIEQTPIGDARFDTLVSLVEKLLRTRGQWRNDERLLVFTEYKTTLDYL
ncbi:MAG: DNA helicase, partial [Acidobacteria bacterium]|nr:DNA helicase [Acidobacteriota bacterium]